MSAWKSRWSSRQVGERADREAMPSTRCIARAWLDTSIATAVSAPLAHHREQRLQVRRLRRGEAGLAPTRRRSAWRPSRSGPRRCPAAQSPARIRNVVVVLPLVPGDAEHRRAAARFAVDAAAETRPSRARTSSTRTRRHARRAVTPRQPTSVSTAGRACGRSASGVKPSAVPGPAGDRGEQVTRTYLRCSVAVMPATGRSAPTSRPPASLGELRQAARRDVGRPGQGGDDQQQPARQQTVLPYRLRSCTLHTSSGTCLDSEPVGGMCACCSS